MRSLKKFTTISLVLCLLITLSGFRWADNNESTTKTLKPFPKPTEGMTRCVINLESQGNEAAYKVEIIPGKTMQVDCNHYSLIGTLEEKVINGWGYTYYEFNTEGKTASTLMACNQPETLKFIAGQTKFVRYNSKLPIVVYVPKGFEVKYRIWESGIETSANEQ